jgi:hypothetical protein
MPYTVPSSASAIIKNWCVVEYVGAGDADGCASDYHRDCAGTLHREGFAGRRGQGVMGE